MAPLLNVTSFKSKDGIRNTWYCFRPGLSSDYLELIAPSSHLKPMIPTEQQGTVHNLKSYPSVVKRSTPVFWIGETLRRVVVS